MAQWFEDDEFWRTLRPVLFTAEIMAKAPAQIDALSTLINLQPGSRILDLPCGVGRHSIELARRGHRVTAVDRTRVYLDEARDSAAAAGLVLECVLDDMRQFRREGAFDVVLNLWSSFGYSEDPADDRSTLANFYASLRPGGTLVMEMNGRECAARTFRERDWRELDTGVTFLEERCAVQDWTRIESRWIVIKDGRQQEVRFGLRVFSGADLKALAAATGFVNARCFGSLSGAPYDHKAERLVLVAEKPA